MYYFIKCISISHCTIIYIFHISSTWYTLLCIILLNNSYPSSHSYVARHLLHITIFTSNKSLYFVNENITLDSIDFHVGVVTFVAFKMTWVIYYLFSRQLKDISHALKELYDINKAPNYWIHHKMINQNSINKHIHDCKP